MSASLQLRARAEIERRNRAAVDTVDRTPKTLIDFTTYTYSQYQTEPAHRLIARHLEKLITGKTKRLMIFAPPQHGKSELASVRFPVYWLGKRPDDPVILCSYAASLAYSFSWQARAIVESDEYQDVFPGVRTDDTSRAKDHWRLSGKRGGLLASGVGGPITGHGAMLGIIDDPFENWEAAQSLTIREKVWMWYRSTFRTRIWEHGVIVLIMTRWHEDDLAGRLLSEQGNQWDVLRLPAVSETQAERDEANKRMGKPTGELDPLGREPGEPLCPQRFSSVALNEFETDVGSIVWFAEYQGTPRAPEGNRFKRTWFEIVNQIPGGCTQVRYWDKAGTAGSGAYTCGVLMARDKNGVYFVADRVHGQWSALEREDNIRSTAELDGRRTSIWVEQEPGSGGKESAEATVRNLAGFNIHIDRVTGSKETRAEPFAAQCEAKNVKLVRAHWNANYLGELSAFPNGKFKDQVDASSGAFNKLPRIRTVLL